MVKKALLPLLLMAFCAGAWADMYTVTGKIVEKGTGEPIEMTILRLMKADKDSSYVAGGSTGSNGTFMVTITKPGSYILRASFLGYNPVYKNITFTKENNEIDLGTIQLTANDKLLDAAGISAKVPKLEMHKDTFVYNVAAYRVPEGSTLEALVDQLPGAVVDDDGGITINGKTVSEIRVDGKDFFKGDTKVAMKNLPVSLINRVKVYDMKSDYTRETGIDDGEDQTVMDLELKQKLKSTWIANTDIAGGTHDRYSGNVFINQFTNVSRISAYGSMNNVGDQRFRGGGPGFRGGGGGGLTTAKSFGIDAFWNNGKDEQDAGFFQIGGNVRYNYSYTNSHSKTNSETFLDTDTTSSFSNSESQSYSRSSSWNVEGNIRWKPDSMTTIYARPNYSHSSSKSTSWSLSATFDDDPYEFAENPLDSMFGGTSINASLEDIAVNTNDRTSRSKSNSDNVSLTAGITRKLNKSGRSVSLDGGINYSKSSSYSYSLSDIRYYNSTTEDELNNQYSTSPSKNWSYNVRLSYSEPIVKNLFFQGSYNYSYSYKDQDRSLYQLDELGGQWATSDFILGTLPTGDSLNLAWNAENSQYATYDDYVHTVNLGFRYVTEDVNFNVGVKLEPQRTRLDYTKEELDTVITRDVFNVAPNVRLRYTISDYSKLELRYRGSSSQPSMTNLLDVTDTSDPLNISMGNPSLKPSWTNTFNAYYNNYWTKTQTSLALNASFSQTSNSISNAVTYDATTGVRTTKPENINGNWNTNLSSMFNSAFGSDNAFNFMNQTTLSYQNSVSFVSTSSTASSTKNKMKTFGWGERIRASFRTDYIEVGLNGSLNYSHSRSTVSTSSNLDTWTFAYGGSFQWTTTWNMSLSTDIAMNSRRGYNDASMNTNELIWNLQLSQSFLKSNAATVSIQCFDLLHEQSNISRTINATMRSDSWSNAINSYVMVHFIYRFSIFAGSSGRISGGPSGGDAPSGEGGGGMSGERGGGGGPGGGGGGGGPM